MVLPARVRCRVMSDRTTPAGAWSVPARSGRTWRAAKLVLFALAVIGGLAGIATLAIHLTSDPLVDIRGYYDAATRLNEGRPLYPPGANPDVTGYYFYPPLFAIILRPFALLPYRVFELGWEALMIVAFALTIRRIGLERRTWLALGILGIPFAWSLAIGQAQILITLFVAIGAPWSVALAGQVKLFPVLAALYWLGRGERGRFGAFLAWSMAFLAIQILLAPREVLAYIRATNLSIVGHLRNISPYVLSPALWAVLFVVGIVATLVLARRRYGWMIAVVLATLGNPRLFVYQLCTLAAGLRAPDEPRSVAGLASTRKLV